MCSFDVAVFDIEIHMRHSIRWKSRTHLLSRCVCGRTQSEYVECVPNNEGHHIVMLLYTYYFSLMSTPVHTSSVAESQSLNHCDQCILVYVWVVFVLRLLLFSCIVTTSRQLIEYNLNNRSLCDIVF